MPPGATEWSTALRQTFRLLPSPSDNLRPFLENDGKSPDEVLDLLPYDSPRAGEAAGAKPNMRRYRDGRQVYQTAGLLYEDDGLLHVTDLGKTVLRWLPILNDGNAPVLGRYAAYSLAACQLRNPTRAGRSYDDSVEVFPFVFIWRAMLALDDKISSEELNRAILKVTDEASLRQSIALIRAARTEGDDNIMGSRVNDTPSRNDRVIPWISFASFGYTLISDKAEDSEGKYYRIKARTRQVIARAASLRVRHREFDSVQQYVRYLSTMAGLPPDLGAAG